MPAFAFAESTKAVGDVAEIADNRSSYAVDDLAPEQQIAGQSVPEVDNVLQEDDQQREPYGRAQVVMDVSQAVQQLLLPSHTGNVASVHL